MVVCLVAGLLGGWIALMESLVFVEVRGLSKEPAGFALVSLPLLLSPTAVAGLTWVLDDSFSGHGRRSARALLGALAGAAASTPALVLFIEVANLSHDLSGSVPWGLSYWSLLGLPVALAATFGSAVATRMGAGMARGGRSLPNRGWS